MPTNWNKSCGMMAQNQWSTENKNVSIKFFHVALLFQESEFQSFFQRLFSNLEYFWEFRVIILVKYFELFMLRRC